MISGKIRPAALMLAGLTLYGSLMAGAAFGAPPKHKKAAPKKPAAKTNTAAIAAGKKVYDANGCANCHTIGDAGGKNGPELTKVGADPKHTAKWLEVAVTNPKEHDKDTTMPAFDKIKGKDLSNLVAYLGSLKK